MHLTVSLLKHTMLLAAIVEAFCKHWQEILLQILTSGSKAEALKGLVSAFTLIGCPKIRTRKCFSTSAFSCFGTVEPMTEIVLMFYSLSIQIFLHTSADTPILWNMPSATFKHKRPDSLQRADARKEVIEKGHGHGLLSFCQITTVPVM